VRGTDTNQTIMSNIAMRVENLSKTPCDRGRTTADENPLNPPL